MLMIQSSSFCVPIINKSLQKVLHANVNNTYGIHQVTNCLTNVIFPSSLNAFPNYFLLFSNHSRMCYDAMKKCGHPFNKLLKHLTVV